MTDRQKTNNGFAILNAHGDLWTPDMFYTERQAQQHMDRQTERYGWDLSKHTIVPAKFTTKWTQPNT